MKALAMWGWVFGALLCLPSAVRAQEKQSQQAESPEALEQYKRCTLPYEYQRGSYCKLALELGLTDEKAGVAHDFLGTFYLQQQPMVFARAAEEFAQAEKLGVEDVSVPFLVALCREAAGDKAGALAAYKLLVANGVSPQRVREFATNIRRWLTGADASSFLYNFGKAMEDIGQPELAGEAYSQAAAAGEEYIGWQSTVDVYRDSVRVRPDAEVYVRLGGYILQGGVGMEFEGPALEAYQRAAKLQPRLAAAHLGIGDVLSSMGKAGEAVLEYQEALRLDPSLKDAREGLEIARAGAYDWTSGLQPEPRPDSPRALEEFGRCLDKTGDGAEAACSRALKLGLSQPRAAWADLYLGTALQERARVIEQGPTKDHSVIEEAVSRYREALRLRPDLPLARYLLGNALAVEKKDAEAILEFQEAVKARPEWAAVWRALAASQEAMKQPGEADAARREAEKAEARLAEPVPAPEGVALTSGLLLSLVCVPEDSECKGPRTLWLAPGPKGLRVTAEGRRLVVPRTEGFWQVVIQDTDLLPGQRKRYASVNEQLLWAGPMAARPSPNRLSNDQGDCTESSHTITPWFIGSHWVSFDVLWANDCGGNNNASFAKTADLDSFRDKKEGCIACATELKDALGPDGVEAYERAVRVEKIRSAGQDEELSASLGAAGEGAWYLWRDRGHWRLMGSASWKWERDDFPIDFDLPKGTVDFDALDPPWNVIQEDVPDATDAFTSPGHDWALVETPKFFLAFAIREGRLGPRLLALRHQRERVVLAQWATEKFTVRWDVQLRGILAPRTSRQSAAPHE